MPKLCPWDLGTSRTRLFTKDVVVLGNYFCNDPPCVLDGDFNLNGILMVLIKRSFLCVAFVTSSAKNFGLSKLTKCSHIDMISSLKLIF